ncbi:uncharacterized protein EI90DRAFT_3155390 [Cantharellus anzutake]|uniref:uncharacterized protein n=1 Tax=Cantharellus anzutake TaxID=1750568 RepID=UPI00190381CA|nr:uncharacterized protein EI90DRAFT_3155390 [Cantharellus anzutake]KAF8329510.1 hypothetical protein EI90DRAFT_3155390 [Cantharellus anzutake]
MLAQILSSLSGPIRPTRTEGIAHARAWIVAYENWDLELMYNLTTSLKDLTYSYLPASAGIPPKSTKEWQSYNRTMKKMIPDLKLEVLDIYECNGCVVAHLVGRATSRSGAPFLQEYVLFIHCRYEYDTSRNESSIKVHKVEEFIDTRVSSTFFAAEKEKTKGKLDGKGSGNVLRPASASAPGDRKHDLSKL